MRRLGRSPWSLCLPFFVVGRGRLAHSSQRFGRFERGTILLLYRASVQEHDHYLHVMNAFRLILAITVIRTRLGPSPDLEEGSTQQKHGAVLFEPLPRGYEGIPMCSVLSIALTALVWMVMPSLRPVLRLRFALTFSFCPILNHEAWSMLHRAAAPM
jgi:hypothetical protein